MSSALERDFGGVCIIKQITTWFYVRARAKREPEMIVALNKFMSAS